MSKHIQYWKEYDEITDLWWIWKFNMKKGTGRVIGKHESATDSMFEMDECKLDPLKYKSDLGINRRLIRLTEKEAFLEMI